MSRLLINEPALQVLPSLATKIGLNEAIALQQLHFRLSGGSMRDGRRWFLRTVKDWHEQEFPFWSYKTVQRTFDHLREMNLVEATDEFNRAERRDLWWTINYEVLEALELGMISLTPPAEKPAPSAVGQNDQGAEAKTEKPAPSAVGQNDQGGQVSGGGLGQNDQLNGVGQNDQLSSFKKNVLTTTPPTPSFDDTPHSLIVDGGAGDAWKNWRDHLGLKSGPAIRLHQEQWAEWVTGGLVSELNEAVTAVIMMGNKASDPSALLKARMERIAGTRAAQSLRKAEETALASVGPEMIPEGSSWLSPSGQTLTVDYVADGYVFWRESAVEAPLRNVMRWRRQGGAA